MGLVPKELPSSEMGGLGEPRQPATPNIKTNLLNTSRREQEQNRQEHKGLAKCGKQSPSFSRAKAVRRSEIIDVKNMVF
jgi:hypothetical protein